MRLHEMSISNYKIFKGEQHRIQFPKGNTPAVFIGVNGAGKTTILEAIMGSLWEFYHKIQGKRLSSNSSFFKRENINTNTRENAHVTLQWSSIGQEKITSGFEIRLSMDPHVLFKGKEQISEYVEALKSDVGYYGSSAQVPIIVYYPVERMVLKPSLQAKSSAKNNPFDAYKHSFAQSVDFDDFFEWFRSTEDLENEIRLNENPTYSNIGLDAVRQALFIFLEDFSRIRVRRVGGITLVLEKSGDEFEVSQLSHGEKAIIAMIGDLARRLVIANRNHPTPLKGKGIVLIDELDLHLHPRWQRTIMQKLQKTFPNIQFICTTHSPLVINHAQPESIFLLEDGQCQPLSERFSTFNNYGADVEDILKIVQKTESLLPQDIAEQLTTLSQLIEAGHIDKASQLIRQLKKVTDPEHPRIKEAETDITYHEITKG